MIQIMLKKLQKEIGIFLAALAVSIVLVIVSQMYWETVSKDKQVAEDTLYEAKEKYRTALNRKRLLEEFENKFKQLGADGVVGDEQRLNWIDVIESTTKQEKLPYVKYKIDKQTSVVDQKLKSTYPGIDVYKSEMILEMDLLHEGDLYTLINNLEDKAKGLFDVSACRLRRNNSSIPSVLETNTDKNFSAFCRLNWFTMKQKPVAALAYSDDENE